MTAPRLNIICYKTNSNHDMWLDGKWASSTIANNKQQFLDKPKKKDHLQEFFDKKTKEDPEYWTKPLTIADVIGDIPFDKIYMGNQDNKATDAMFKSMQAQIQSLLVEKKEAEHRSKGEQWFYMVQDGYIAKKEVEKKELNDADVLKELNDADFYSLKQIEAVMKVRNGTSPHAILNPEEMKLEKTITEMSKEETIKADFALSADINIGDPVRQRDTTYYRIDQIIKKEDRQRAICKPDLDMTDEEFDKMGEDNGKSNLTLPILTLGTLLGAAMNALLPKSNEVRVSEVEEETIEEAKTEMEMSK